MHEVGCAVDGVHDECRGVGQAGGGRGRFFAEKTSSTGSWDIRKDETRGSLRKIRVV